MYTVCACGRMCSKVLKVVTRNGRISDDSHSLCTFVSLNYFYFRYISFKQKQKTKDGGY